MVPHMHMNGHATSLLPLHGHTTHMHGCDDHGHSHRHLHRHRHDYMYDCNCDRDNGNASLAMPALACPHPLMGTLVAARHAGALAPSVGPSCHSHDATHALSWGPFMATRHACVCPRSGPLVVEIWGLHSALASALGCNALGFAVMAPSATLASSRPG
jgi:hypothetical protein